MRLTWVWATAHVKKIKDRLTVAMHAMKTLNALTMHMAMDIVVGAVQVNEAILIFSMAVKVGFDSTGNILLIHYQMLFFFFLFFFPLGVT